MNDKYDKLEKRLKPLENIMNFKERDLKLLYWFVSLVTIPVFSYIYSFPLAVVAWAISILPFINFENNSLAIERTVFVICFVLAFITQFYMWKLWKNKKKNTQQGA